MSLSLGQDSVLETMVSHGPELSAAITGGPGYCLQNCVGLSSHGCVNRPVPTFLGRICFKDMPLHLQKALAGLTHHHSKEHCYKLHCTYSSLPSAVVSGEEF